jgi:hypothetical protein
MLCSLCAPLNNLSRQPKYDRRVEGAASQHQGGYSMAIDAAIEAGVGIVESPPRYYEGSESGYSARSRPFDRAYALPGGWKAVGLP